MIKKNNNINNYIIIHCKNAKNNILTLNVKILFSYLWRTAYEGKPLRVNVLKKQANGESIYDQLKLNHVKQLQK